MKVLIVHNRYRSVAPSGENRVVDQESHALQSAGHDVEHFERHSDEIEHWPALRKAALPLRTIWNATTRNDLAASILRFGPDVVHVHNTFPILSPAILDACREARVPVVATLHNYKLLCASGDFFRRGAVCHDCAGGRSLPALVHRCYRGSLAATVPTVMSMRVNRSRWRQSVSAYICISASLRELLSGLDLDPDRVFIKPNLIPHDPPLRRRNPAPRRQVAYLGRLDEAKGVRLLMRAWDHYRAIVGDEALRLVIAGAGPLSADVAAWAEARPSVSLVGHLTKSECTTLIARSRAVVLPSQWEETFGLVAVEAMAIGVPSIASAHGSFPDLISDGVDGALFSAGIAEDLAKLVQDVDQNSTRYAEYGRRARMTYEKLHDPKRNLEQLLDVYRFAITRPVAS